MGAQGRSGEGGVEEITAAWARELPGIAVEGMATVTRLWQLAKVFGDQRRRVITERGADQATLDLLSVLRRAGPPYALAPGEIARRAMVTAGAISQRLARAEQAGLVERDHSGRERTVRLLPAGHDLVDRLVGDIAALDDELLAALAPAQREVLDQLLMLLLDDAEQRLGRTALSQVGAPAPPAPPASPMPAGAVEADQSPH